VARWATCCRLLSRRLACLASSARLFADVCQVKVATNQASKGSMDKSVMAQCILRMQQQTLIHCWYRMLRALGHPTDEPALPPLPDGCRFACCRLVYFFSECFNRVMTGFRDVLEVFVSAHDPNLCSGWLLIASAISH
jgi:hypothetical protein